MKLQFSPIWKDRMVLEELYLLSYFKNKQANPPTNLWSTSRQDYARIGNRQYYYILVLNYLNELICCICVWCNSQKWFFWKHELILFSLTLIFLVSSVPMTGAHFFFRESERRRFPNFSRQLPALCNSTFKVKQWKTIAFVLPTTLPATESQHSDCKCNFLSIANSLRD